MNIRTILLFGGLGVILLTGIGVIKIKHGLLIGAGLTAAGFLMPDTGAPTA